MASHQLAIAKASFSAGLLRPDPTSLSREDIAQFHTLLNAVIILCTSKNVQNCKNWILKNIIQSTARFTALGKYLTTLSNSFVENGGFLDPASKREPSIKRKRLHLLYLVNDLLHHAKFRINDASVCGKLQPILMSLVGSAASFKGCPKHQKKIVDLLSLWEEKGYYSNDYIDKLREAVKNAAELGVHTDGSSTGGDQNLSLKTPKSTPFVMPAMHGDVSTPWFDLPAGNLMPHIIPNSTRPINPDMIKPLQFVAGPADEGLVIAVKGLLDDVQKIFGGEIDQDEKVIWDIDELGQPIILDEITGDVLEGEGYYGWSRTFCERMFKRRKGLDIPDQDENRGRLSRSQSQSRSATPDRKRRRYSRSDDGSSPVGRRPSQQRRYSSSRSRSRSPRRNARSRSGSRDRSYSPRLSPSPRRENPMNVPPGQERQPNLPQKLPGQFNQSGFPQDGFNRNGPPPPPPPSNMPYGVPPNLQYPMPPNPPQHPPPQNQQYTMPYNSSNRPQYGQWGTPQPSFAPWPPPPPPPPPPGPPPFQPQQQQQGAYPPNGPGGWQQPQQSGPGGWQQPNQPGNGRGFNNGGWNANGNGNGNGNGNSQGRGGRGNYRGRGW